MEGITDEYYRNVVCDLFPEWDSVSADFLRVPNITTSLYPDKHVMKHYGEMTFQNQALRDKTIYQILTSPNSFTQQTAEQISRLGFKWLDLNLGCPSKTVCKNQGGSYLLSDLKLLAKIIKEIRDAFSHTFTCKIRVGYKDDLNFERILKTLEDLGVDAIKIHGRTRDELYKGVAKWEYTKRAVQTVNSIPIIGNGDIWTTDDIEKFFDYTNCHSVMIARGALKTPWLAKLYKDKKTDTLAVRAKYTSEYFHRFYQETLKQPLPEASRIKRLKSVSRYIFDEFENAPLFKRRFLLSKSFEEQIQVLEDLKKNYF